MRSCALALLLVHRGSTNTALLLVVLPDTFTAQGDLDQILSSVRTL